MRRLLALLASVFLFVGCASSRSGDYPNPVGHIAPPAGLARPASVPWLLNVAGTSGGGTGFATTYRGNLGIMTAWHVVSKGDHGGRVFNMGASIRVQFYQLDGHDIAWAPTAAIPKTWEILQIAPTGPELGEYVEAWGYPANTAMGTRGQVTDLDAIHDHPNMLAGQYLEVLAEVRHGMSGGPVLNDRHQVVCVVALSTVSRRVELFQSGLMHVIENYRHYPVRIPWP